MTLAQLKTVVAAYLQKAEADLTIGSVDMFLIAANNVRREAELLHDFEASRTTATLSIDGVTGGSLDDAVILGQTTAELDTMVVSGALTPNATGTYTRGGDFNGRPYYVQGTSWAIWYFDSGIWALDTYAHFVANILTSGWQRGSSSMTPPGTYTPVDTDTGTATVTAVSRLGTYSGVKSVVSVSRMRSDGTYIPIDFTRSDLALERERTSLEYSSDMWPEERYPSDAQWENWGMNSTLVQRGRTILPYPALVSATTPVTITMEVYGMLQDYTETNLEDTTPTDYFVQFGARFLQWAIICELNYLFPTFVPRQEGVLAPPEAARETAWRNLLLWDTYLIDPNSTRSR